ncbi:MAG: hypothetical protein JNJ48_04290 [Phycisphaerae bacterium]|nr:hypothetical protein [Phycisphaerae bacterium]
MLRSFLAERDAPCPSCGYNLRGLTGSRCPECDQALELRVGLVEPRLAAWVAGLVGLATGTGFSGLLVLYWLTVIAQRGRAVRADQFVLVTGGGLVVEGLAMWAWLRFGAAIRRLPSPARRVLALGCWALTGANFWVFAFAVR